MQCDRDHRWEFAASKDPGSQNRKEGFEPCKRRKSPKHADCHPTSDGVWSVTQFTKMRPRFTEKSFWVPVDAQANTSFRAPHKFGKSICSFALSVCARFPSFRATVNESNSDQTSRSWNSRCRSSRPAKYSALAFKASR